MAKTLDNTTKLQQKLNWLQTEHDALPAIYQEKKDKVLANFTRKANKKLLPAAFAACDKEQYATCQLGQQLQSFDSKHYLTYRQIHHTAAKAIFAAKTAGQDWTPALQTMELERARHWERRSAYIQKLEGEKTAFLAKHPTSDTAAYEALKQQLQAEKDTLAAKLDADLARQLQKKQAALRKKMDEITHNLAARKPANTDNALPEDVVLSIQGLKMYFGGLKAVDDLSFDVRKGEIYGLIGPNGAGKTTVFNCITQFYKPTDGQLLFRTRDGETITLTDYPVHDIVLKGIARTFQNLEVVKEVSVLDNLLIAATRQYTSSLVTQMLHLPKLGREERAIRARAEKILKYMDLYDYRARLAWGLPYGVLKRLEIARALMCNPQLIILDEPAAGLNESETADLAELINRIRADFECTILLVEHDMSLVMNVCDHICAISFGRKLAEGTAAQIQASREVQEAYLGTGEA
jgi:branched-chain amino acid transport system ATP-binding protein